MSRIGNAPVAVPSGVEVSVSGRTITVKGPKGTLSRDIPGLIEIAQEEGTLTFTRPNDERQNRAMHGLVRSLVSNMVTGVTEGFKK
ncbi:MAG: 50S ribosomal protein L6, partial [Actinomycetota bacterium]|nr:50S ribosomal protein L6 [Actinomycetota bacterium]